MIATVGLAILGLNGLSIGFGEAITLASALIYAVHIVGLSAWSQAREALGLATVQLMVTAQVSLGAALVVEGGVSLPTTGFDWLAILYMAVVSGAVAMIVQSWAGEPRAVQGGDHDGHRTGMGGAVLDHVPGRANDLTVGGRCRQGHGQSSHAAHGPRPTSRCR